MIVVHYWFPAGFYGKVLRAVQGLLMERGMVIVPDLIGKLLEIIGAGTM